MLLMLINGNIFHIEKWEKRRKNTVDFFRWRDHWFQPIFPTRGWSEYMNEWDKSMETKTHVLCGTSFNFIQHLGFVCRGFCGCRSCLFGEEMVISISFHKNKTRDTLRYQWLTNISYTYQLKNNHLWYKK